MASHRAGDFKLKPFVVRSSEQTERWLNLWFEKFKNSFNFRERTKKKERKKARLPAYCWQQGSAPMNAVGESCCHLKQHIFWQQMQWPSTATDSETYAHIRGRELKTPDHLVSFLLCPLTVSSTRHVARAGLFGSIKSLFRLRRQPNVN